MKWQAITILLPLMFLTNGFTASECKALTETSYRNLAGGACVPFLTTN